MQETFNYSQDPDALWVDPVSVPMQEVENEPESKLNTQNNYSQDADALWVDPTTIQPQPQRPQLPQPTLLEDPNNKVLKGKVYKTGNGFKNLGNAFVDYAIRPIVEQPKEFGMGLWNGLVVDPYKETKRNIQEKRFVSDTLTPLAVGAAKGILETPTNLINFGRNMGRIYQGKETVNEDHKLLHKYIYDPIKKWDNEYTNKHNATASEDNKKRSLQTRLKENESASSFGEFLTPTGYVGIAGKLIKAGGKVVKVANATAKAKKVSKDIAYSNYAGKGSQAVYNDLKTSEAFNSLSKADKAKIISAAKGNVYGATKETQNAIKNALLTESKIVPKKNFGKEMLNSATTGGYLGVATGGDDGDSAITNLAHGALIGAGMHGGVKAISKTAKTAYEPINKNVIKPISQKTEKFIEPIKKWNESESGKVSNLNIFKAGLHNYVGEKSKNKTVSDLQTYQMLRAKGSKLNPSEIETALEVGKLSTEDARNLAQSLAVGEKQRIENKIKELELKEQEAKAKEKQEQEQSEVIEPVDTTEGQTTTQEVGTQPIAEPLTPVKTKTDIVSPSNEQTNVYDATKVSNQLMNDLTKKKAVRGKGMHLFDEDVKFVDENGNAITDAISKRQVPKHDLDGNVIEGQYHTKKEFNKGSYDIVSSDHNTRTVTLKKKEQPISVIKDENGNIVKTYKTGKAEGAGWDEGRKTTGKESVDEKSNINKESLEAEFGETKDRTETLTEGDVTVDKYNDNGFTIETIGEGKIKDKLSSDEVSSDFRDKYYTDLKTTNAKKGFLEVWGVNSGTPKTRIKELINYAKSISDKEKIDMLDWIMRQEERDFEIKTKEYRDSILNNDANKIKKPKMDNSSSDNYAKWLKDNKIEAKVAKEKMKKSFWYNKNDKNTVEGLVDKSRNKNKTFDDEIKEAIQQAKDTKYSKNNELSISETKSYRAYENGKPKQEVLEKIKNGEFDLTQEEYQTLYNDILKTFEDKTGTVGTRNYVRSRINNIFKKELGNLKKRTNGKKDFTIEYKEDRYREADLLEQGIAELEKFTNEYNHPTPKVVNGRKVLSNKIKPDNSLIAKIGETLTKYNLRDLIKSENIEYTQPKVVRAILESYAAMSKYAERTIKERLANGDVTNARKVFDKYKDVIKASHSDYSIMKVYGEDRITGKYVDKGITWEKDREGTYENDVAKSFVDELESKITQAERKLNEEQGLKEEKIDNTKEEGADAIVEQPKKKVGRPKKVVEVEPTYKIRPIDEIVKEKNKGQDLTDKKPSNNIVFKKDTNAINSNVNEQIKQIDNSKNNNNNKLYSKLSKHSKDGYDNGEYTNLRTTKDYKEKNKNSFGKTMNKMLDIAGEDVIIIDFNNQKANKTNKLRGFTKRGKNEIFISTNLVTPQDQARTIAHELLHNAFSRFDEFDLKTQEYLYSMMFSKKSLKEIDILMSKGYLKGTKQEIMSGAIKRELENTTKVIEQRNKATEELNEAKILLKNNKITRKNYDKIKKEAEKSFKKYLNCAEEKACSKIGKKAEKEYKGEGNDRIRIDANNSTLGVGNGNEKRVGIGQKGLVGENTNSHGIRPNRQNQEGDKKSGKSDKNIQQDEVNDFVYDEEPNYKIELDNLYNSQNKDNNALIKLKEDIDKTSIKNHIVNEVDKFKTHKDKIIARQNKHEQNLLDLGIYTKEQMLNAKNKQSKLGIVGEDASFMSKATKSQRGLLTSEKNKRESGITGKRTNMGMSDSFYTPEGLKESIISMSHRHSRSAYTKELTDFVYKNFGLELNSDKNIKKGYVSINKQLANTLIYEGFSREAYDAISKGEKSILKTYTNKNIPKVITRMLDDPSIENSKLCRQALKDGEITTKQIKAAKENRKLVENLIELHNNTKENNVQIPKYIFETMFDGSKETIAEKNSRYGQTLGRNASTVALDIYLKEWKKGVLAKTTFLVNNVKTNLNQTIMSADNPIQVVQGVFDAVFKLKDSDFPDGIITNKSLDHILGETKETKIYKTGYDWLDSFQEYYQGEKFIDISKVEGNGKKALALIANVFNATNGKAFNKFSDMIHETNNFVETQFRKVNYAMGLRKALNDTNFKHKTLKVFQDITTIEHLANVVKENPKAAEVLVERVNNVLGDYNNFTKFEKNVVERLFPFSSWTRARARSIYNLLKKHPDRLAAAALILHINNKQREENGYADYQNPPSNIIEALNLKDRDGRKVISSEKKTLYWENFYNPVEDLNLNPLATSTLEMLVGAKTYGNLKFDSEILNSRYAKTFDGKYIDVKSGEKVKSLPLSTRVNYAVNKNIVKPLLNKWGNTALNPNKIIDAAYRKKETGKFQYPDKEYDTLEFGGFMNGERPDTDKGYGHKQSDKKINGNNIPKRYSGSTLTQGQKVAKDIIGYSLQSKHEKRKKK